MLSKLFHLHVADTAMCQLQQLLPSPVQQPPVPKGAFQELQVAPPAAGGAAGLRVGGRLPQRRRDGQDEARCIIGCNTT